MTIDRRTGIGASEVYDVVEGDRLKVWRKKVEGWEEPDNPDLKRGRRLERTVLEMYDESLADSPDELWVRKPQVTYRSVKSAVLFATPDAERAARIANGGLSKATVDAKTTATWKGFGEEGTAQVPNRILFQGITQMHCVNVDECDIVVLMPSHELRVYKILRDRETEGMLIEKVEQFWRDYVVTKKPPLEFIDHSDGWMEWLNQRYPQETEGYLVAEEGSDLELHCLALQMIQGKKGAYDQQEKVEKNIIRNLLEKHAGVQGKFGRIDYKKTKDGEKINYKGIVEAALKEWKGHPELGEGLECLEMLIKEHTTDKPGVRALHPYWKGSREE